MSDSVLAFTVADCDPKRESRTQQTHLYLWNTRQLPWSSNLTCSKVHASMNLTPRRHPYMLYLVPIVWIWRPQHLPRPLLEYMHGNSWYLVQILWTLQMLFRWTGRFRYKRNLTDVLLSQTKTRLSNLGNGCDSLSLYPCYIYHTDRLLLSRLRSFLDNADL